MINPDVYSAGQVMGSWLALLAPISLVVILFVLGFWVFNREAPHIAEDL
jgi:ABC-2 type transport system permease protein